MASDKQTEANRLNAQKSTGPRSAEGRARSCLNALRTGIDAESIVLPGEDPAAVEAIRAEYYQYHQPITPDERDTLDHIIHAVVLTRRFRKLEAQLTRHEMDTTQNLDQAAPLGHVFSNASHKFVYLQSRMNSVERSFHRNQDRLQHLKSLRPPLEDPPPAEAPEPHSPPAPQPTEPAPQTPELASNPDSAPTPQVHPARPEDCPHCRKLGFISRQCPRLRAAQPSMSTASHHGTEPLPGHPARLEDCPNCRNLGYISPNCHYVTKEPRE